MKKQVSQFKIETLERLNNSVYGNPKYRIIATTESGETVTGRTATDAAIGYILGYQHEGRTARLSYHYTRGGSLIFDAIA